MVANLPPSALGVVAAGVSTGIERNPLRDLFEPDALGQKGGLPATCAVRGVKALENDLGRLA